MGHRIAVVMPYKYHCSHIREVLQKFGYSYPVYHLGEFSRPEANLETVIDSLQRDDVKVIISGRTVPTFVPRLNLLSTPILRSRLTFIRAFERALSQYSKAAVILARGIYYDTAEEIIQNYNGRILLYSYEKYSDIEGLIRKAAGQGAECFIGTVNVILLANQMHFASFEIPYEEDDILFAVKTAEYNLKVLDNQLVTDELIRSVWNRLPSGIVIANDQNRVTSVNEPALKIIGCHLDQILDQPVAQSPLLSQLDFSIESESLAYQVVETENDVISVSIEPITIDASRRMTLYLLEPIQQMQNREQKIRQKLYHKGNMATISFSNIIGHSRAIKQAIEDAKRCAQVDSPVVVYGETGTGKEMFVQSIHNASRRATKPFVAINCGALPENLLESLLFGYEKGAFTGATQSKRGYFEIAQGGTIFLDEIGEMPLSLQARFLRVLQEKEVMPLGSDRVIPVDVRVIAATNRDLGRMVQEHSFRSDLYYRLNVLSLRLPPLRERQEDIPALAQFHLLSMRHNTATSVRRIAPEAMQYLSRLPLEGNVRQLTNIVERAVICSGESTLSLESIRRSAGIFYREEEPTAPGTNGQSAEEAVEELYFSALDEDNPVPAEPAGEEDIIPLPDDVPVKTEPLATDGLATRKARAEAIRRALYACGGHKGKAAQLLGISPSTLYRRMKELQIE